MKTEAPKAEEVKPADAPKQEAPKPESKVVAMPQRQPAKPSAPAPAPRVERSGAPAPAAAISPSLGSAREIGVDVHEVQGTGPAGRI